MRMHLTWIQRLLVATALGLAATACGDDDGSPSGGADAGNTGDSGKPGAQDDAGATGTGDGSTQPPAPVVTCDTTIPTTATCGDTDCPAITGLGAMFCQVPCCVADACGVRSAVAGMTTACSLPPEPDPSCPDYEGMLMTMPISLPGCCTAAGVCGVISSLSMTCITTSMILTDLMPGPACGSDDGGTEDGG